MALRVRSSWCTARMNSWKCRRVLRGVGRASKKQSIRKLLPRPTPPYIQTPRGGTLPRDISRFNRPPGRLSKSASSSASFCSRSMAARWAESAV